MDATSLRAATLAALIIMAAGCDAPRQPSRSVTGSASLAPRQGTVAPAVTPSRPPDAVLAFEQCPVTDRAAMVSPPPGRGTDPLRPNLNGFYGPGQPDRGGYIYKLPWTAYVDGELEVTVHRLDAPSWGRAEVTRVSVESPPPGARGFFAGSVWVPALGCWQVTGTINQVSATFIFKAG